MAQLVLGIGMSHSTMVTLDDSLWGEWAAQDATIAILFDTEGQAVTYAQLAERTGDRYAQQATPQHWKEQYAVVRQAVARLAVDLASAKLDVLVVVGDDQLELFSFVKMPSLAIFYGDRIPSGLWTSRFATYQRQGRPPAAPLSQRLQRAVVEGYAMDVHREFASAPTFARELLASLIDQGFNVAGVGEIPPADESIGLGHALRVGIVASGSLSHFVTDERIDRQLFAALRAGSEKELRYPSKTAQCWQFGDTQLDHSRSREQALETGVGRVHPRLPHSCRHRLWTGLCKLVMTMISIVSAGRLYTDYYNQPFSKKPTFASEKTANHRVHICACLLPTRL
jgi:hypothetical protein